LGEQFDSLGLTMPRTKDGLRELVEGMDLSTTAGRATAATLIALSPQFATIADGLAALAKETATQLMATFTAGGQLLPALAATQLKVGDFGVGVQVLTGELSFINKIMGDASSGVISFGAGVVQLDTGLSDSQRSAGLLTDQVEALRERADKARIDFAGLGAALLGVDTATFVNTIGLVFEGLASRISGVIDGISAERVAVRDAALQIINPTVMSKAGIERGIAGINTALPSNAGVVATGATLTSADAGVLAAKKLVSDAAIAISTAQAALVSGQAAITAAAYASAPAPTLQTSDGTGLFADLVRAMFAQQYADAMVVYNTSVQGAIAKSAPQVAVLSAAATQAVLDAATPAAALTAANAVKDLAEAASKKAILDYSAAMQNFAIDASKSVGKLTKLREETVKYYEAQKQLAGLMTTSAAGIRSTISAYTFGQKTDEQKYQDLAGQFSTAYTMSKITTGEALAGYGDKINALINPMIEALSATGRDSQIANYLAQAEAAAVSVDNGVISLGDYQADSLGMLGSIDATLAALDASSQSAEKIISAAINAGSDKTAEGLRGIIRQLGGVPAFANGGAYQGGLALVGEQGPELINFDQPGQVYTASQTRGMLSGGRGGNTARLEALVERQAQQLEAIARELIALRRAGDATASSNEKMAKQGDRYEVIGMPVRNAQGQSFETVVAA
jgi:hypothetical protein